MGSADVDVVRRWLEVVSGDLKRWAVDDEVDRQIRAAAEDLLAPDFEFVDAIQVETVGMPRRLGGLDAWRAAHRDFSAPFASYREEPEEARDLGDGRVLVLGDAVGITRDGGVEVRQSGGVVFTVKDGRITRFEYFLSREDALGAAGLSG